MDFFTFVRLLSPILQETINRNLQNVNFDSKGTPFLDEAFMVEKAMEMVNVSEDPEIKKVLELPDGQDQLQKALVTMAANYNKSAKINSGEYAKLQMDEPSKPKRSKSSNLALGLLTALDPDLLPSLMKKYGPKDPKVPNPEIQSQAEAKRERKRLKNLKALEKQK